MKTIRHNDLRFLVTPRSVRRFFVPKAGEEFANRKREALKEEKEEQRLNRRPGDPKPHLMHGTQRLDVMPAIESQSTDVCDAFINQREFRTGDAPTREEIAVQLRAGIAVLLNRDMAPVDLVVECDSEVYWFETFRDVVEGIPGEPTGTSIEPVPFLRIPAEEVAKIMEEARQMLEARAEQETEIAAGA